MSFKSGDRNEKSSWRAGMPAGVMEVVVTVLIRKKMGESFKKNEKVIHKETSNASGGTSAVGCGASGGGLCFGSPLTAL